ncbi:MAG: hypothetical protein ACRC6E_00110 [Fusobacteriaceae bacterium]
MNELREFVIRCKDSKEYFYRKVECDFHGGDIVDKRTDNILTLIGSNWMFADEQSAQIICDEVNARGISVEVIEVFKQSVLRYSEI